MEAKHFYYRLEDEIVHLKKQEVTSQQQIREYELEVEMHKEKQQEILLYSRSITENNTISKVAATDLQCKVMYIHDSIISQTVVWTLAMHV